MTTLAPPARPSPSTRLAVRDPLWRDVREFGLDTRLGRMRALTVQRPASGTPHLLLHGLGVTSSTWLDLLPLLADLGPVVAIDLPGFGRSETSAGVQPDLPTLTGAVEAARQALGWPRMVLHGNSLGGLVAARHARRHPSTVEHLVMAAPAFSPGPAGIAGVTPASLLGIAPLVVPGLGELATGMAARAGAPFPGGKRVWRSAFADPENLRDTLAQVFAEEAAGLADQAWRRKGMLVATRSLAADLAAWWRTDRLADQLAVPVTVITGAEDRLLPAGSAQRLRRRRPDWRFEELAGAGHSPFVERPFEYLMAVLGTPVGRGATPGPA